MGRGENLTGGTWKGVDYPFDNNRGYWYEGYVRLVAGKSYFAYSSFTDGGSAYIDNAVVFNNMTNPKYDQPFVCAQTGWYRLQVGLRCLGTGNKCRYFSNNTFAGVEWTDMNRGAVTNDYSETYWRQFWDADADGNPAGTYLFADIPTEVNDPNTLQIDNAGSYGACTPSVGEQTVAAGATLVCTATAVTNLSARVRSVPIGYTIETYDSVKATWSAPEAHEGNVYSHTQVGTETTRLTWQWKDEIFLEVQEPAKGGSLTVNGLPIAPKRTSLPSIFRTLPDGYEELDYIEKQSGLPCIDTGIPAAGDVSLEASVLAPRINEGWGTYYLFGATGKIDGSNRYFALKTDRGGNHFPYYGTGYVSLYDGFAERSLVKLTPTGYWRNHAKIKRLEAVDFALGSPTNIFLFGCDMNGSFHTNEPAPTGTRFYSCRIWKGETLVRNFVPARRVSDDIAGLYDKVNGVFYPSSQVNTAFVAGPTAEVVRSGVWSEWGASVTLTAVPTWGWVFSGWAGNVPEEHRAEPSVTFDLDAISSVGPTFVYNGGFMLILR